MLDVKMPKIDGFELYQQMKKIDGKAKVCFMTAFDTRKDNLKMLSTYFNNNNDSNNGSNNSSSNNAIDNDNDQHIIQKPISMDDLIIQIDVVHLNQDRHLYRLGNFTNVEGFLSSR